MIIIKSHNKVSKLVENWYDIVDDAEKMLQLMDSKKYGNYGPHDDREALALSHCQVSEDPQRFFVVNRKIVKNHGQNDPKNE